jgi:SM-20-related protein
MRLLSDQDVASLGARGHCVVQAPAATFAPLAQWCRKARSARLFSRASTGRARVETKTRTDSTLWFEDKNNSEAPTGSELARAHFEQLREELNVQAYLGLKKFEVQLARYAPGNYYQRHIDAFSGQENRRVTAIVYLNERWRPEHGGRLIIHGESPSTVEPSAFTMVIFLSEKIEHEVEVTTAARFAVTAWYAAS